MIWIRALLYLAASCIAAVALSFFLWAGGSWLTDSPPVLLPFDSAVESVETEGPPGEGREFSAIGEPFLSLGFAPAVMQLPDLKRQLTYLGKNDRPDALGQPLQLHFLLGQKSLASTSPNMPLYITLDEGGSSEQYIFSSNNRPTSLWLTASIRDGQAAVVLQGRDLSGAPVSEPAANGQFTLVERDWSRLHPSQAHVWEVGGLRVDPTLLLKQRARWVGKDVFLERHGGAEYAEEALRERIDFGDGEQSYSLYVEAGDVVVWDGERWRRQQPSEETQREPLALVRRVEDRMMVWELWDIGGYHKQVLNLLKSGEAWNSGVVEQQFRYVGARTRNQFTFEIGGERRLLRTNDWLLHTERGWQLLQTPEEIDAYLHRQLVGPLFIFEGLGIRDRKQSAMGELFSPSRAAVVDVALSVGAPGAEVQRAPKQQGRGERPRAVWGDDSDDDDDDDDDDEVGLIEDGEEDD